MDSVFGSVKLGSNVDIQRSDGRIHSAVVSGLNNETVTVEWFERGETKGKEIEIELIFSLNPDMAPQQPPEQTTNTRLNRYNARQSKVLPSSKVAKPRQSYMQTSNGVRAPAPQAPPDYPAGSTLSTIPAGTVSKATGPITATGSRKCSNVVKEVEKLQKKREERREKQNKKREEREALMNNDPGNPNWEFLAMIREYQTSLEYRPLKDGDPLESHQITVCVRKRPLSKKEVGRKEIDVVTIPNRDQIIVHEPRTKVDLTKFLENQHFRFDYAFDDTCDNAIVYKYGAQPLIDTIFDGGMATCFAYGQTGSGKTHTMGGTFNGKAQDANKGIYAMAARDVFRYIKMPAHRQKNLTVSASYFEIYSGKVFDLLNAKAKLRVLEDGRQQVQVVGLTERPVGSMEDVLQLIQSGNNIRTSGQTSANNHSSRSHAVFQIILRLQSAMCLAPERRRLHGKFSLIDLAGNERGADTSSADRTTRMEGAEINKSLLALKECIRALGRKGAHLPFRASKLTQVLRDSFIGEKSKTCMIAMISPGLSSCEHSLNTLRYADRVKELGAVDPNEMKPEAERRSIVDEAEIIEDDLAQLRSLNACELSADLYNFHEAVSHLQAMEEEVLDLHKSSVEKMAQWRQVDLSLLQMTNEVDYDVDAYVQQLEDFIAEKLDLFSNFKKKVAAFRSQLAEEEKMSRSMHPNLH